MIAENKQREYLGQAMAYVEDSFAQLDTELMRLNEELRKHG
jgi:hypothetical protein